MINLLKTVIFSFILSLFLLITPSTSHASLEYGPEQLAVSIDAFMINSQFHADNKNYRISKQTTITRDGKQLISYEINNIPYGTFTVEVDPRTNTIVKYKNFIALGGNNEQLNRFYDGWLWVITSRYGEPQEEKGAQLFFGERVLAKYATFSESGHYKYYFGAYRTSGPAVQAKVGMLFEVTAL